MCPDAMFSCEQVNKSAALYASVEGMSQSNAPSSRWSEWPSGFQCPWGAIGRGRRGGRVTKGPEGAKAMTGSPFRCPDHGGARDRLIGSLDFHCILLHFPFASCYQRLPFTPSTTTSTTHTHITHTNTTLLCTQTYSSNLGVCSFSSRIARTSRTSRSTYVTPDFLPLTYFGHSASGHTTNNISSHL